MEYIIVQAGGQGSRLKKLTRNKPKALVSIDNLPIIFHLFRQFPEAKFIIIGDYKCDVLRKYLAVFATVKYEIIDASGHKGTCAGVAEALQKIPVNHPFMMIWCDLILDKKFDTSALDYTNKNYVGLSKDFQCRWMYKDGIFSETPSSEYGVAGLFAFVEKSIIETVPYEGEFVRWLSTQDIPFDTIGIYGAKEYGLFDFVNSLEQPKCRPFNRLIFDGDKVTKIGIDEQGEALARRERNWYSVVASHNFESLPTIYSLDPLVMQRIDGEPIYKYGALWLDEKKQILGKIIACLRKLHALATVPADYESLEQNYIGKTLERLNKVQDLIPFARDEYITINGKVCKNFYFCVDRVADQMRKYYPQKFHFIHGDSTFSNILLDKSLNPVLIDPRGYFGNTELYGDVAYDWAKVYYSLATNYDQFNLKNFDLCINSHDVTLSIPASGWEELKTYFLALIKDDCSEEQLNLILALIWLSLTTYAWDDYDSICGAFYMGLLVLNNCPFMEDK